jgi:hypothetical protein
LPLIERKSALKKLLGRRRGAGPIHYSDHVQGQGGPSTTTPANSGWRASSASSPPPDPRAPSAGKKFRRGAFGGKSYGRDLEQFCSLVFDPPA